MTAEKKLLEVGDTIWVKWWGISRELRPLKVTRVTKTLAFCGESKFKREIEGCCVDEFPRNSSLSAYSYLYGDKYAIEYETQQAEKERVNTIAQINKSIEPLSQPELTLLKKVVEGFKDRLDYIEKEKIKAYCVCLVSCISYQIPDVRNESKRLLDTYGISEMDIEEVFADDKDSYDYKTLRDLLDKQQ